jgi:hypothetical protein
VAPTLQQPSMARRSRNGLCRKPKAYEIGLEAFIGLWDAWEVPWILQDHRFIDEIEVDSLYAQMHRRANPESVLLRYVRQAYLDYGKANKFLH